MKHENFFPESKHFNIKTNDKRTRRKLINLLIEKSITTEDLGFIFECVEPKPDPAREKLVAVGMEAVKAFCAAYEAKVTAMESKFSSYDVETREAAAKVLAIEEAASTLGYSITKEIHNVHEYKRIFG